MQRMKKSCDGCRALWNTGRGWFGCQLGFKIDQERVKVNGVSFYRTTPKEICPKPKTWQAYFKLDPITTLIERK